MEYETCDEQLSPFGGLLAVIQFFDLVKLDAMLCGFFRITRLPVASAFWCHMDSLGLNQANSLSMSIRLSKPFHNVDMIANALLEYNRALEIKPSYTKALNEIGWIYYNTGRKEAAIKQWKKP